MADILQDALLKNIGEIGSSETRDRKSTSARSELFSSHLLDPLQKQVFE